MSECVYTNKYSSICQCRHPTAAMKRILPSTHTYRHIIMYKAIFVLGTGKLNTLIRSRLSMHIIPFSMDIMDTARLAGGVPAPAFNTIVTELLYIPVNCVRSNRYVCRWVHWNGWLVQVWGVDGCRKCDYAKCWLHFINVKTYFKWKRRNVFFEIWFTFTAPSLFNRHLLHPLSSCVHVAIYKLLFFIAQ